MTIIPYMCCLTQKWQNLRNSWPIPIQAPTLLEIPVCMYTVSKTYLWNVYIEILPYALPMGLCEVWNTRSGCMWASTLDLKCKIDVPLAGTYMQQKMEKWFGINLLQLLSWLK